MADRLIVSSLKTVVAFLPVPKLYLTGLYGTVAYMPPVLPTLSVDANYNDTTNEITVNANITDLGTSEILEYGTIINSLLAEPKYMIMNGFATNDVTANWVMGGTVPWYIEATGGNTDNGYCFRSGVLAHSQSSEASISITGPTTLTFDTKVSSEANYDKLQVYLDEVEQLNISGVQTIYTARTIEIPSGAHTIKIKYSKDGSGIQGDDCARIDNFRIAPNTFYEQIHKPAYTGNPVLQSIYDTGLSPNKIYYCRAFARTYAGMAYSPVVQVSTGEISGGGWAGAINGVQGANIQAVTVGGKLLTVTELSKVCVGTTVI